MLVAITRDVSPAISNCELTFVERQPIDHGLACRQLEQYRAALQMCGVEVRRLAADGRYPDSCFVEDTAIVVDELAIMASMGAPSRRGETEAIEAELSTHRVIARVTLPATVDGGDVLRVGRRMLVGRSSRTNEAGIRQLASILKPFQYKVIPVRTSRGLHLKSACTAINDETLLLNQDWVDIRDLDGFELIFTPRDEASAANILKVEQTLFVQAGFPKTMQRLQEIHSIVEAIDTSELQKAEGALTCLSIIFKSGVSGGE
jgi:dimethylargininase